MNITYIIENCVIYTPSTHTLHSSENGNHVTLAIPASLCLNMLIQKKGEIITQTELLYRVWAERGMNVTTNTLYQNISLLRKSLRSLNLSKLIIQTIPKRGFMISNEISILVQKNEFTMAVSESSESSNVSNIRLSDDIPVSAYSPATTSEVVIADQEVMMKEKKGLVIKKFSPAGVMKKIISWEAAFFFILLALTTISCVIKTTDLTFTLASYHKLSIINGCTVFRDNGLQSNSYYGKFIENNHIICTKGESIYITNHCPSSRASVITCQRPIDSGNQSLCTSTYYLK